MNSVSQRKKAAHSNINKVFNTIKPDISFQLMENASQMNENVSGSLRSYLTRYETE